MKHASLLLYLFALILFFPKAQAEDYNIFVGDYDGSYSAADGDVKKNRDLSVSIRQIKRGFNVGWSTTTFKNGKPKTKKYSIDFLESDRENIFAAAQKKNVFGGRDPLDPMKGEPYAWARLEGRKLSVFVLTIDDHGGYEMQTYDRTLVGDDNLEVGFTRIRNGEVLKKLEATLKRRSSDRQETDK